MYPNKYYLGQNSTASSDQNNVSYLEVIDLKDQVIKINTLTGSLNFQDNQDQQKLDPIEQEAIFDSFIK